MIAGACLTQTTLADAAPAVRYRVVEESRSELVTAGAVFIGLSVVSLGYGMHKLNTPDRRTPEPADSNGGGRRDSGDTGAYLPLGLAALFGAIGVPLVVYGTTSKRRVLIPLADARVSVGPSGLALSGSF